MKDTRKRYALTLQLGADEHEALKIMAEERGVSMSSCVRAILRHKKARELLAEVDPEPNMWRLDYQGRIQSALAWAKELGLCPSTVRYRLRLGLSTEEVLNPEPLARRGRAWAGTWED